jgi:hypothetical protein
MISKGLIEDAKKQGKKITLEEAADHFLSVLNNAIENFEPFSAIAVGNTFYNLLLANPKIRSGLRKYYDEVGQYLEKYGLPSNYNILILDPEASVDEMVSIYDDLQKDLESKLEGGKGLLLMKNDQVIESHQKDFKQKGVYFFPEWKNDGSMYRLLLKAAEKQGKTFEMIKINSGWAYLDITSSH